MKLSSKYFYIDLRYQNVMQTIAIKLIAVFHRFIDIFRLLPIRILRVLTHCYEVIFAIPNLFRKTFKQNIYAILFWVLELHLLIIDCFGITEIYEILLEFFKFNSRPLHDWEIELAREVFGDSINYKRVRIDEYAFFGPRQKRFAYVSFYHINSWGALQNSILIHELVHVWQFEQMGSVYIPRAVAAQFTMQNYDYGGVDQLRKAFELGKDFLSFNYEQQGDIVADYFRIKNGYRPQWGYGGRNDLAIYEYFINQIREIGMNV